MVAPVRHCSHIYTSQVYFRVFTLRSLRDLAATTTAPVYSRQNFTHVNITIDKSTETYIFYGIYVFIEIIKCIYLFKEMSTKN